MFARMVLQCTEAGLLDGSKIFFDSSLVDPSVSNNSVIDTKDLKHQLHKNNSSKKPVCKKRRRVPILQECTRGRTTTTSPAPSGEANARPGNGEMPYLTQ